VKIKCAPTCPSISIEINENEFIVWKPGTIRRAIMRKLKCEVEEFVERYGIKQAYATHVELKVTLFYDC